jgi:hypothetical protein
VYILINNVELSAYVKQVTLNLGSEPQDASSVAATAVVTGTRIFLPGLRTASLDVDFLQDLVAAKVDATLYAINVGGVAVTISFRPTAAAQSANNPTYSGSFVLESYGAISGNVGEMATAKASFKPASAVTRVAT